MGGQQSCAKTCSKCTADCARTANTCTDDFDEEKCAGDPAGATFEETLVDLCGLDRQLLLFAATSNLAAVRWLLHLGARYDACDAHGTTCLHVACRAGTADVVRELLRFDKLLNAADSAAWTPLHIAVLIGRREIVVMLLQVGAKVSLKNRKGQLPADLCADNGTYEVIHSFEMHQRQTPRQPWHFPMDVAQVEDFIGSRLQYEPFFVPRSSVVRSAPLYKNEFQRLGMQIFNRQPGFGLAFLIAAGVARDYPVDMSAFLRKSKVDVRQVGSFLGEAFSLSHTIRLEFINSIVLQGTGVVSALIQVFHWLQLPDDLQKINRLVHGVARIWWRQHERLQRDLEAGLIPRRTQGQVEPLQLQFAEEMVGLELKQYLTNFDALHQIMFSTVLLHWYLYRDGCLPKRELGYMEWQRLNAGIEKGGGDVPEHVQRDIHSIIRRGFIPELVVLPDNRSAVAAHGDAAGGGPDAGGGGGTDDARPRCEALAPSASMEGWSQLDGGGFPRPQGLGGVQTVTYKHASSIFSEVTHGTMRMPFSRGGGSSGSSTTGLSAFAGRRFSDVQVPASSAFAGADAVGAGSGTAPGLAGVGAAATAVRRDEYVWLTLCCNLLFFSASPEVGFPYAFIELRRVGIAALNEESRVLSLVGTPEREDRGGDAAGTGLGIASEPGSLGSQPTLVNIVLLLPDGRWQELSLQKLELRVSSREELQTWSMHLMAACHGRVPKPLPSEVAPGSELYPVLTETQTICT